MASGDSPPQRRSFFGSLFCGAATVYKSLGFGAQEESEKCDRDTDTVEMSSMTQKVCEVRKYFETFTERFRRRMRLSQYVF